MPAATVSANREASRAFALPAPGTPPPSRICLHLLEPVVDGGRYAAKCTTGDELPVRATIVRDGHDVLRAVARARPKGARRWSEAPLALIDRAQGGDTFAGTIRIEGLGPHELTVQAWVDSWPTWRDELRRKLAAGQTELDGELSEGALYVERAIQATKPARRRQTLEQALAYLRDASHPVVVRAEAALNDELDALVDPVQPRAECLTSESVPVWADRERARFGAWYELFPRSFGGFDGVAKQLPRLAELGFDVVYLPPIHPIGRTNRKGRNNSPKATKGDVGSPWAIGASEGGHDAIHPDLGTDAEFVALVEAARECGMEIALDFAIQCTPDHPWVKQHPEWFQHRPDGSIKFAENPPKRYTDIVNVDWNSPAWPELWEALHGVVRHWIDRGVRIFRVDNPHTKPLPFWEWLIGRVRATDPDVVFLSEAFTRRAMMHELAKLGFSQSYTYFTWKNGKTELREFVEDLAYGPSRHFLRPNFFVNTPDILTEYLVQGGRPAFEARLVLAATLSPTYGMYSGFEYFENVPVRPDSEEYLDSEKYELKQRDLDGPLLPLVQKLNHVRRAEPALHHLSNLWWLETENEGLLAYAKRPPEAATLLCVVNVDPHNTQEGVCIVPYELGLPPAFAVEDVITGHQFDWRLGRNYVRLEPGQSHVLRTAQ